MHLTPMQYAMVATSVAIVLIQATTLRILATRKVRSEFPIFFGYTACSAGVGLVGVGAYLLACNCLAYDYLYWACSVLMMCFQFGVMYESFVNALKPYVALIDLGKMLFRWAGLFLLLAALLTGFASRGAEGAGAMLERTLGLMQAGLLVLFFAFERRLGLAWRSYSMAIALGLGISAATTLGTSYVGTRYPALQFSLSLVANLTYLAMVSFWVICFRQAEPARKNVTDSPSRLIFQRWNDALLSQGYGQPAAATGTTVESFLPGIEKTVDRVMARSIH